MKKPTSYFFYPVGVRHSATLSTGDAIWAFKNPLASGKIIRLKRFQGTLNFDGTAAAANVAYDFSRFSGGNAPTDGGAVTVSKAITRGTPTSVLTSTDIRVSAGAAAVTMGGSPTFETQGLHRIALPISVTGTVNPIDADFGELGACFLPGEGLAIRLVLASAAGVALNGSFWAFEEDPL